MITVRCAVKQVVWLSGLQVALGFALVASGVGSVNFTIKTGITDSINL